MDDVAGKYIWIIGASSGIGAALARELSSRGGHIAVSARSKEKLDDLVRECGGEAIALPFDVSDENAMKDTVSQLQQKWPRIDSAIHMAAMYRPETNDTCLEHEFVKNSMIVNVVSMYDLARLVIPVMKSQKDGGQLVLCGSVAGYRGLPGGQPYCATKAAVKNYAESLRIEYHNSNIDIKLISPGFVKTQLTDKNKFTMPMIIEADKAACYIADGMVRKSFEIHFPKVFTFFMKFLSLLPDFIYLPLAHKVKP